MSDRLKGLRDKRGRIVEEMKSILDKSEEENREATAEELEQHGTLFDEQNKIGDQIKAEERQVEIDRRAAEDAEAAAEAAARNHGDGGENRDMPPAMIAFRSFLRNGTVTGEGAEEFRALQADADTEGGYIVPPEEFVRRLIKFVDDETFIRARATVFPVANADSLGVPSLDTDPADADWTNELATGSEDSSMAFGKRALHPHPLAKRSRRRAWSSTAWATSSPSPRRKPF